MKLRRGQTELAQQETDKELQRYSSEDSIWHWRFKVLKAEILARHGSIKEALELLRTDPPGSFKTADLAVRRKLVQGVASASVPQPADAKRFLAEGKALATAHHPELLGELAIASGAVDFLQDDFNGAAAAYQDALQIARKQNDAYVQASALGGLGLLATKEEHYDESIDWNEAALQLAQSPDVQGSLNRILGNMAWNYKKLGDLDAALTFYQRAGDVAARAGFVEAQIYWLTGTADVYYERHDYIAAEKALSEGLGLARSQGNERTLTAYLNGLAEAELEAGRMEAAEKYNDEAGRLEENSVDRSQILATKLLRGRIDAEKHEDGLAEKSFRSVIEDPKCDMSQKWEAEARLARVYADTGRTAEAEAEFRRAVAVIEAARASVPKETLRLSFLSSAINFYSDYIDFLISQHRMDDALRLAEVSRADVRRRSRDLDRSRESFLAPLPARESRAATEGCASFLLAGREALLSLGYHSGKDNMSHFAGGLENRSAGQSLPRGGCGIERRGRNGKGRGRRVIRDACGASAEVHCAEFARDTSAGWQPIFLELRDLNCSGAQAALLDRRRHDYDRQLALLAGFCSQQDASQAEEPFAGWRCAEGERRVRTASAGRRRNEGC